MRRALVLFALLGAVAFPTAAVTRAETVLRIDEVPIGELDPMKAKDTKDSVLLYNVYDTLVFPGIDGNGNQLRQHLAEKIDIDGSTYTITVRDGVKFHSGNVLDAEDVVFSLNRMLALKQGFSYLFGDWVESATAKDMRTAVVKLKSPYAPFYSALVRLAIVDKDDVLAHKEAGNYGEFGDYGQKYLNTHDAGTGAYRVESHDPQNLTVMRKFKDYFLGVSDKAPDVARSQRGLRDATVLTLMSRGEEDISRYTLAPETMKALAAIDGISLMEEPGIAQFVIKMNTTRAPLDDVHCRRALAFVLDYEAMRGQTNISPSIKGAVPAKSPLLPAMLGYDSSMPDFARDTEKAKAELAQCRYKPGDHVIEISWIGEVAVEERFALLMQENWSQLGFQTKVMRMPWVLFTERATKPETTPHIGQLFYFARSPDSDSYLWGVYHSSSQGQYLAMENLRDSETDRLLEQGRSTTDPAKRAAIYRDVSRHIIDLMPTIFVYQTVNLYPKRNVVMVPTLEKPNRNTGLMGGNLLFRVMEMKP